MNRRATVRSVILFLTGGLAPLSEAGFQVAVALTTLVLVSEPPVRSALRGAKRHELLFAGSAALWLLVGFTVTVLSPASSRSISLNYAYMLYAALAGWAFVRSNVSPVPLICGMGIGAALALLAGSSQLAFGTFPGEALLHDGRRWRGQLYIPGTKQRAATGTLMNRIKMGEAWIGVVAASVSVAVATPKWRRFAVGVAIAALVMMGLSFSKAATATTILTLGAVMLVLRVPVLARPGFFAFSTLVVGVLVAAAYLGFQTTPTLPEPRGSLAIRPFLWSYGVEFGLEHPVVGHGLGTYFDVAKDRVVTGKASHFFGSHQQLLTVFAEGGLIGLLAFVSALGVALWSCFRALVTRPGWGVASAMVLLPFALMFSVHDVLFHAGSALLFWGACGIALAAARGEES